MRTLDAGREPPKEAKRGDGAGPARAFGGREALGESLAGCAEEARPKRRYRSWKSKSDDEVVSIAQESIDRNRVSCKSALWEEDAGLADRLRKRGLWGRVRFYKGENGAGQISPAAAEKSGTDGQAGPGSGAWKRDDALYLAQSAVDELGLICAQELEALDPELHSLAKECGVLDELRFPAKSAQVEPEAGGERRVGQKDGLQDMGAEQLRKADLRGVEPGEEGMFRLILAECFRIGTGSPYVGSLRGTIPKLQSNMNRKLSGHQHRLFRKCWDRMEAEGVIAYNTNSSAASLDISGRSVRDRQLASALSWAVSEQSKIGQPRAT